MSSHELLQLETLLKRKEEKKDTDRCQSTNFTNWRNHCIINTLNLSE